MKRKKLIMAAALGFFVFPALAYQWPVESPAIAASFGQNFFGGFYRGTAITGKSAVRPIEKGELVFYSTGESGDGVPSVLGGFAVIQHDKNLRSVYGHLLLDEALRSDKKTSFAADDTLGTVSDTGLTQSPELYLAIKDLSLNQSVNPCLVLPRIEERTRPTIRGVVLSSGSTVIALGASVRVPAGEWEIFADIFDEAALAYFRPCAVYRTAVSVNGQEIFQLAFDALKEKDGLTRVYPSRDLAFRDVYSGEWRMKFGRVYLQRGMANLEIRVRDFAGNERAQSFQFRVE